MKIKFFKYIALGLVVALTSCSDWLEESNPNMPDKDSYWVNLDQTNATLTAAYAALVSDYALNIREEAPRSDLATPGFGRPTYEGEGAIWYNHVYTNTTKGVQQKWEILYMGIFRANQVIEGLQNMSDVTNEEEWTEQMAQARFLRGLYHFYLHSTYNQGNILIKDKVAGSYDDMNQSLSTSDEVIEFFMDDLQYAYDHLPASYESDTDKGRATKGAAATIMGTSYLYQATLSDPQNVNAALVDSARVKFEDVINSGEYKLVDDMSLLFTTAGEMNDESIFEIAFSNTINAEYSTWVEDRLSNRLAFIFNGRGSNKQNVFPSIWITHAYLKEAKDMLDPRNMVEDVDEGTTVERPVSLRASAMIALVQDEYTEYYGQLAHNRIGFPSEASGKLTQNGFSRFKHYINHDIVESENDLPGGTQHSGKNITLNRLGDVYMMLAECYIYQNRIQDALDAINTVRKRWALELIGSSNGDAAHSYNEVFYDQSSLLERLQNFEKPLETSVEGHCIRWFDLRRWGMLKDGAIFKKRAAEQWWTANFQPSKGPGTALKICVSVTDTYDPTDTKIREISDYGQAAINFNYDIHAWYPIPSTENLSNTEL